ncbi:MAG TPA: ATP-dependent DNA helicase RecQ [Bryobacteraceae bacterium]|nr:ATP-dependent DNA helicase RecQ [Bryobacteraceae bacterium]
MVEADSVAATLQRYWGYLSFRPLQERAVQSILAGRDCAVVMPTGGGKSLCYQLPALILGGTAIVISPLIALMQDQVVQLRAMDIPAAFLNTTLPRPEQSRIMMSAAQGAFRLLYLSPERLANPDTIAWLRRVPVSFFAIDEAHCISEWGHEFRPDYRQLIALREQFPDKPIAAFTASATQRVRHDILSQLGLRDPDKLIASFRRPNLRFTVKKCANEELQNYLLRAALTEHKGSAAIVYASTIQRVMETADWLLRLGIPAVPYHGQMDAAIRKKNQELWMSDERPVMVGTLAFGLGINKACVRTVVHLSLPKSIEQYYQEAGRAGRDGLPSDCLLLWQYRDVALLAHFIQTGTESEERERSWQRYHRVRRFAETSVCRQWQICEHFGEKPKWEECGQCDICVGSPPWLTVAEGKGMPERKRRPIRRR